jgi:hypothetical protein
MAKKTTATPTWYDGACQVPSATTEGGFPSLDDINQEAPMLREALEGRGSKKDGGFPPMGIKLVSDCGVLKFGFTDAHNRRSAFVTLTKVGGLGEQLGRILEAGNFDWRPWGKNKDWA